MRTRTLFLLGGILCLCTFGMKAQTVTPEGGSTVTTRTVVQTSNRTALIQSAEMKKVWKESLVHAIVIPSQVGVKSLITLNKLLQNTSELYNPENTLVIYEDSDNRELISDICKGYAMINLNMSLDSKASVVAGEITPVASDDRAVGYDFKVVMKKELGH